MAKIIDLAQHTCSTENRNRSVWYWRILPAFRLLHCSGDRLIFTQAIAVDVNLRESENLGRERNTTAPWHSQAYWPDRSRSCSVAHSRELSIVPLYPRMSSSQLRSRHWHMPDPLRRMTRQLGWWFRSALLCMRIVLRIHTRPQWDQVIGLCTLDRDP